MKILHCCLACFYIDNYGYQENLLPKQHKIDGHEVEILTSTETYLDHKKLGYVEPHEYISESGIPIKRLAYKRFLPHFVMRKLRLYKDLYEALNRSAPDIIFIHDCQFLDIRQIAKYARINPGVRIYVDCHTDFNNSGKNWLSKYILHGLVYRYCAKVIEPYVTKFYGVLPCRCDFLRDVYGLQKEKIDLLVLGAEDTKIHLDQRDELRERICKKLGLDKNNFIIVTGGKLDRSKNAIALLDALNKLDNENLKLIIFGSLGDDVKNHIEDNLDNPNLKYLGWIEADKAYDYFTIADLAVFPGLHSVLWEQAIACGTPCVFKDIDGIHHVDMGGNCMFLKEGNAEEIADVLKNITEKPEIYAEMKKIALMGASNFLYSKIAKKAISDL
jgi:1,2-diacylglycerol 3-alpha-glucosyltransferase